MPRKKEVEATPKPVKPVSKTMSVMPAKSGQSSREATAGNTNTLTTISQEERYKMIAQTAYFRAESRGFHGGDPTQDWLIAEQEVDLYLNQLRH